jgi:lipopolysaccharide/colanic/teichoic acid biosynthesis glycosyltransferase
MLYKKVKRIIDLALSITALLFLLPIFLVVALLVGLNMGAPIIFCQLRPGLSGKLFEMYKFRTMLNTAEDVAISDETRITKLGRFLRATSLDELPELLNVIRGDMSLIGPRPLLIEYLDRYTATQMRRHEVLPGISGLAQVKGRNNLTWNSKFRYDVFYVEHIGWRIDLMILLATVKVVLLRSGFRSHGEAKKFGK